MSSEKYTDVMVEVTKTFDLAVDLREVMDLFVQVEGCSRYAIGVMVSEEDVRVILRRDNTQFNYAVKTPTECGAGTEYDIHDAVMEIFEVAGIKDNGSTGFSIAHSDLVSLAGNSPEDGEFDAAVCTNIQQLHEELDDILGYRVIDWS